MLIDHYADDVVVWAPAKVNLYLEVLRKRADGYHEIATLMVAIRLFDTLVFKEDPSGAIVLRSSHAELSTGADNLVVRAAELLRQETGCRRGAAIRLVKRIPLAAGLAGGSTDAAATLAGLNRLWNLGLGKLELAKFAAQLGSDVPFFFDAPAAWCTGRGEQIEALPLGQTLNFVLLCPPFGLSTADVYRNVSVPQGPQDGLAMRQAFTAGRIEDIGRLLHNRLQEAADKLTDELAEYRRLLAAQQPAGLLMSGSGSTLFALCRDRHEARRIARALRRDHRNLHVFHVRSF
jgi:4-diphosphocytidyl-2-C-methyl-D-erythritol kinase